MENKKLPSLTVTVSSSGFLYEPGQVEVAMVQVGNLTVGYLYKEKDQDTWYVYGYLQEYKIGVGQGDLRILLGESTDVLEMADRVLQYQGYKPMKFHCAASNVSYRGK